MGVTVIEIPAAFAADTAKREGAAGVAFVAALPSLLESYVDSWDLAPCGPAMHGYVGMVVPVRRSDGTPAALKVSWRDRWTAYEADSLRVWAGAGAALLLESDVRPELNAMALLLEWLDPARSLEQHPDVDRATVLCATAAGRLAVPAPEAFPTVAENEAARWVTELPELWERLGRPLPRRAVEVAVESCREFATDRTRTLLHGDLHYANILAGEREPWLAIDPKGIAGEAAYESITVLWNRTEELGDGGVGRRLAIWSEAAGVDPDRARRWAQARAVDDVLWQYEYDMVGQGSAAAELAVILA
jgi:streptomycin 6-kinase